MKALLIGGTGTISLSVLRGLLAKEWEVWTLNRGRSGVALPEEVKQIHVDINNPDEVKRALEGYFFDTVAEFIAFSPSDVERDYNIFKDKTNQYIFVSSASAYQKPPESPFITEETPLDNPYWEYSRNKKECEEFLFKKYREEGFPLTVIRPSHTYDDRKIPVPIHGKNGSWAIVKRMLEGKKVLVPGDGTSLWTVTWTEDFAVGFVGVMGKEEAIGEAYQITGSESLTWNQILSTIAKVFNCEYKPCYVPSTLLATIGKDWGYDFEGALLGDKANSVIFVNDKIRKLVPEFATRTSFLSGAIKCRDRILSNPSLQKEDKDFDAFSDMVVAAMERAEEECIKKE